MNQADRSLRWPWLPARLRGVFNLNDPRWGRGEDGNDGGSRPEPERPLEPRGPGNRGRDGGPSGQPPDLDELWRDLNRKLSGLFGGRGGRGGP
ncbi:protease modulator HflK N-terminal domain-containing protein, partial [Melaminivora alkalimesophila]